MTYERDDHMRRQEAEHDMMAVGELKAPDGWFLHRAAHEHTGIVYRGDKHEPLPHGDGPWIVEFQRYPSGGLLTGARGHTMREAWSNAIIATKEREREYPQ